ncbi:MAG: Fic family protein [Clostridiales bacterium]|nr:Fic family protein [Clostridiales bacterium]MCF8022824.1 Fic family protein [Clostridiales bacterium]
MSKFQQLDKLKIKLDSYRPFSPAIAEKLREQYIVDWTHHSTAIEGNTLSLKETRVVLEGITVGGKTLREHLEITDHRNAIEYVEDYINEEIPLTESFIRNVHYMVLKNSFSEHAGKYRNTGVTIAGSKHKPPSPVEVPALMKDMVQKYNNKWQDKHPVKRAALLHFKITHIHPFVDGNGRTARLLMNFSLMQSGFPPAIFKKEHRLEYLEALEKASSENKLDDFLELTVQAAVESTRLHLETVSTEL